MVVNSIFTSHEIQLLHGLRRLTDNGMIQKLLKANLEKIDLNVKKRHYNRKNKNNHKPCLVTTSGVEGLVVVLQL